MPVVVCCGSSEQADYLQRELSDDINLRVYELPNETTDEVHELRTWYTNRTGRPPPDIGGDDILLVQLFFEWQAGQSLQAFARRLRHRIIAASPNEIVATP